MADLAKLVVKLEAQTAQYQKKLETSDRRLKRFEKNTKKSLSNIASSFKTILGGVALASAARGIVRYSDEYTNLSNRLRLATNSSDEFARAQAAVFGIAQDTRQSLSATAELYQRLALSTKELGLNQRDLEGIVTTVNQSLVISGASAQAAEAAIIQLGQGLAAGALRGQEFNSVAEQAPRLMRALADSLGVGIGELREMSKAGELTAEVVTKALKDQSSAIEQEFKTTATTVQQSLQRIDNALTSAIGSESQEAAKNLTAALNDFADLISDPAVVEGIGNITAAVTGLIGWFVKVAAAAGTGTKAIAEFFAAKYGSPDVAAAIRDIETLQALGANIAGNDGIQDRANNQARIIEGLIGFSSVEELEAYMRRVSEVMYRTTFAIGDGVNDDNEKEYLGVWTRVRDAIAQAITQKKKFAAAVPATEKSTKAGITEDQQKAIDKAKKSLDSLNADLSKQVETFGLGEAAVLRYRLTLGDLAEDVKLLGPAGQVAAQGIIQQAQALERLQDIEGFNQITADLTQQAAALQMSEKELFIYEAQTRLSATATDEMRVKVQELAGALFEETEAQRISNEAKTEGASLTAQLATPLELLNSQLDRYRELLLAGAISQETYNRAIDSAGESYDKAIEGMTEMSEFAKQAARNIQDQLGDTIKNGLKGDFDGILASWGNMLAEMGAQALAAKLAESFGLGDLLSSGGGSGGGGGLGDFFGGFFADGGQLPAGKASIVGENGPELAIPRGAGTQIIPNHQLGGGQTISIGNMVFPGVTNEKEAKRAGGAISRELTRLSEASRRY